ncbi:ring-opening amidohydrolase [Mollisia scopiformis]|uniref:Cyanuric acid amidohydrolase n=1 Tax=Mollisia scopiformis TaxID=149040 RepID=A0A132B1W0_MOLSC|nr:ring-opening amidohydrolase [Mollisia scopiformis]KUJ06378.1 ring-opening amidohydrolase [Mollisia scopiformis]
MASINVLKYGVSSPADLSPMKELRAAGYESKDILAVIGKSEGNGCVNDFSRTLSTHVWEPQIPESAVTIFSGGTEGVLSPHVTFIMRDPKPTGLLAAVGKTRVLEPHEIGTTEHALQVASSVRSLMDQSAIRKEHVHLVLNKCPLLTSAKVEVIKAASKTPVTTDTYESMAKSRYASAIGIAIALEEIEETQLHEAMRDENRWSSKASCSSGAELEDCHILIIASNPSLGNLRAASAFMADAIDARTIIKILDQIKTEGGHVLQVFAKAEADPTGNIRQKRHTMNTDSDLHSTRHARAAVGGLIAGLTGDTQIYVSGGAEDVYQVHGNQQPLFALLSFVC